MTPSLVRRACTAIVAAFGALGLTGCGGEPTLVEPAQRLLGEASQALASASLYDGIAAFELPSWSYLDEAFTVVPATARTAGRADPPLAASRRLSRGGWEGVVAIRGIQGLGKVGGHMYLELVRRDARTGAVVRDEVFEALADGSSMLSAYQHPFGVAAPGFPSAAESHDDEATELSGVGDGTHACLARVVAAWEPRPYPVDGAVFGGVNSNSFVRHMMASCGLSAELPSAWYQMVPGDALER